MSPKRVNIVICLCSSALLVLIGLAYAETSKLLPEASAKEIKNNVKILLTKLKVRDIPLAQDRSEKYLAKLYKEERQTKQEIEDIQKNLELSKISRRIRLPESRANEHGPETGRSRATSKVLQLTHSRMADLEEKRLQLSAIQSAIAETKKIIQNPENYVFVPTNYGKDPEGQREIERELLIKDRENMQYRYQIASGEIDPPLWITDNF